MDTEIQVAFLRGGTPVGMFRFNVASDEPSAGDEIGVLVGWAKDAFSVIKDIWKLAHGEGGWNDLLGDIATAYRDISTSDKNKAFKHLDHWVLLSGGAPPFDLADTAEVTFLASSDDDVTTSFGRLDPAGKIVSDGEQITTKSYRRSFRIPLNRTPAGPYIFSFGTGDDGTIFKEAVGSILVLRIAQARHSGFLVQSRDKEQHLVAPQPSGGVRVYVARLNGVLGQPLYSWHGPYAFATDLGQVDDITMIQSVFGDPANGNLEIVVRTGNRLALYFHVPTDPPDQWSGPFWFATDAAGCPALVQSTFGTVGHFQLLVPNTAGSLSYYWRDNDPGANLEWHGPYVITPQTTVGRVEAVALIQSTYGPPGVGQLEAVARIGSSLAMFTHAAGADPANWDGPHFIAGDVRGVPALIQGRHGDVGNYELVSPLAAGGLGHFWRNNDPDQNLQWNGPYTVLPSDAGLYDAVTLTQDTFFGSTGLGRLNVAARAGNRVTYLSRADAPPMGWSPSEQIDTPKHLVVTVQPPTRPLDTPVTLTVFARDEVTHTPVDGEIFNVSFSGTPLKIGRTNTPFTYTFHARSRRQYDPVTHRVEIIEEPPVGLVKAATYPDMSIEWGF